MSEGMVLQFGTGRFLRSFVDMFVHEADTERSVVAVQSTGADRVKQLNTGPFHVAIRGMSGGACVDKVSLVASVRRGLSATEEWDSVLELGCDPDLGFVVSNTTEAGLSLDPNDHQRLKVPASYPAKLLDVLTKRYYAGCEGLVLLPCELVNGNGAVLRELVLDQAKLWQVESETIAWLREANTWCDTLVDRIVSAPPEDDPLLAEDPLLSVAEPFALWVVASQAGRLVDHPAIQIVDDVGSFSLRKVRILNGAHTALVERALGQFTTVQEAVGDAPTREWLESLVNDEIVPCVSDHVEDAAGFAEEVFERFENPFLYHRLEDIALHQSEKVKLRLLPSYEDYRYKFGKSPVLLEEAIGRYLN